MLEGITSNPIVAKLQASIAFAARRHELIVNNIANVATPGFKARDLSETAFTKALGGGDFSPEKAFKVIPSPDAAVTRSDGNNVSIEREMSKLSSNAIRHNVLISLLNKQIKGIESALRERVV